MCLRPENKARDNLKSNHDEEVRECQKNRVKGKNNILLISFFREIARKTQRCKE